MHRLTPTARNTSASAIMSTAAAPACAAQRISTAAPTSTKRIASAAIHSLPNLADRRLVTFSELLILRTHAMLITASSPDTDTMPLSQVSTAISRNDSPRIRITFVLLRT